jgi:hypothetical protein
VREDGEVHRVVGVGVLRDGVEEGAPAKARRPDLPGDGQADRPDHVLGTPPVAQRVGDPAAHRLARLGQVGDDEVLLAGEVAVERRAGHPRLGDDPIDADGVDALGVEDPARRADQPLSRFGSPTPGFLRSHDDHTNR